MRLIGPLRRPLWLVAAIGESALEVALSLVKEARAALEEVVPQSPPSEPAATTVEVERPMPRPKPRPRSRPALRPPRPARPVSDKVKTIDDEPVPVAQFGEEGARDDAGAEVRVDAPWDGYDAMKVADVKARLAAADRETLAAVVLYEGFGRKRRSVIEAAEKRLTRLSVPGS